MADRDRCAPAMTTGRRGASDAKPKVSRSRRVHEALGERARIGHRRSRPDAKSRPVCLRDAPVAADLVAKVEALGDPVVGLGLAARLELRDLREPLGREEAALDRERLEGELRLAAGGSFVGWPSFSRTFGSRTKRPMTSGREERLHAVAAARVGGLAHAAVVGEERLGAPLGERVEVGRRALEQCSRACATARSRTCGGGSAAGGGREQRERVGALERCVGSPAHAMRGRLLDEERRACCRAFCAATSWWRSRRSATVVRRGDRRRDPAADAPEHAGIVATSSTARCRACARAASRRAPRRADGCAAPTGSAPRAGTRSR